MDEFGELYRGILAKIGQENPQRESSPGTGILVCQVCGKTEEIKKCTRCEMVGYCGKGHQTEDWKIHKKICKYKDG